MAAVAVRGFPSTVSRLPLRRATLRQRGAQSTVAMAAADMQEKIKSTTASNPVVVYSKTYCPYCISVKNLFQNLNVKAVVVELDTMGAEGSEIQGALADMTGQRTVPSVWIGNKHIGGCDSTMDLNRSGKLEPMLKAAGAV